MFNFFRKKSKKNQQNVENVTENKSLNVESKIINVKEEKSTIIENKTEEDNNIHEENLNIPNIIEETETIDITVENIELENVEVLSDNNTESREKSIVFEDTKSNFDDSIIENEDKEQIEVDSKKNIDTLETSTDSKDIETNSNNDVYYNDIDEFLNYEDGLYNISNIQLYKFMKKYTGINIMLPKKDNIYMYIYKNTYFFFLKDDDGFVLLDRVRSRTPFKDLSVFNAFRDQLEKTNYKNLKYYDYHKDKNIKITDKTKICVTKFYDYYDEFTSYSNDAILHKLQHNDFMYLIDDLSTLDAAEELDDEDYDYLDDSDEDSNEDYDYQDDSEDLDDYNAFKNEENEKNDLEFNEEDVQSNELKILISGRYIHDESELNDILSTDDSFYSSEELENEFRKFVPSRYYVKLLCECEFEKYIAELAEQRGSKFEKINGRYVIRMNEKIVNSKIKETHDTYRKTTNAICNFAYESPIKDDIRNIIELAYKHPVSYLLKDSYYDDINNIYSDCMLNFIDAVQSKPLSNILVLDKAYFYCCRKRKYYDSETALKSHNKTLAKQGKLIRYVSFFSVEDVTNNIGKYENYSIDERILDDYDLISVDSVDSDPDYEIDYSNNEDETVPISYLRTLSDSLGDNICQNDSCIVTYLDVNKCMDIISDYAHLLVGTLKILSNNKLDELYNFYQFCAKQISETFDNYDICFYDLRNNEVQTFYEFICKQFDYIGNGAESIILEMLGGSYINYFPKDERED